MRSPRLLVLVFPFLLAACAESQPAAVPSSVLVVPQASSSSGLQTMAPAPALASPSYPSTSAPAPAPPPPADEFSDADVIARYAPTFKALLAEVNGVSTADLDRVVTIQQQNLRKSPPGSADTWLVVGYTVTIDWLTMPVVDTVLVRRGGPKSFAKMLTGGVEQPVHWLTAAELSPLMASPFSRAMTVSKLTRVCVAPHLKYPSKAAALAAMKGGSSAKFFDDDIRLELPNDDDKEPHVFLDGMGHVAGSNDCATARVDLVTGKIVRGKTWCGPVS